MTKTTQIALLFLITLLLLNGCRECFIPDPFDEVQFQRLRECYNRDEVKKAREPDTMMALCAGAMEIKEYREWKANND